MQNEKQTQTLKVYENIKILTKNFDLQTKGTHWRKMFGQAWQFTSMMNKLREKKVFRKKGKGPTSKFSYGLKGPDRQDQEIEKFLPHLTSTGFCKTSVKKRGWWSSFAPEWKTSDSGLRLHLPFCQKQALLPVSCLINSLGGKTGSTHKWKLWHFRNRCFRLPKF